MSIFYKIKEVFTKEYRKEIEYREFLEKNIDKFKLKSDEFDVTERIDILKARKFKSNFQMPSDGKSQLVSIFHSKGQEEEFSKIAENSMNTKAKLGYSDIEK